MEHGRSSRSVTYPRKPDVNAIKRAMVVMSTDELIKLAQELCEAAALAMRFAERRGY